MAYTLWINNDNTISVKGLHDPTSGSFMNDATISLTLTDSQDIPVTGQAFPVVVDYIADSDGNYQATLENTLNLTDGASYIAVVTATSASGINAEWQLPAVARIRN